MRLAYVTTGGLSGRARPQVTTEFEIHAADCNHVSRRERDGADVVFIHAANALDLVESEVAEYQYNDQDWTVEDFRIFPCCD